MEYNGWTNRETWSVNLLIMNDAGLCSAMHQHPQPWTAESARDFVLDILPDVVWMGVAKDYFAVNWQEIADAWNERKNIMMNQTMPTRPRYKAISSRLMALQNCRQTENAEWADKHEEWIVDEVRGTGPSGSGIDCGTSFDFARSKPNKLVFFIDYHHMDDAGGYDGWTSHSIIVRPSLYCDIDIKITGRDRNEIKDYLADTFHAWLTEELPREKW